MCQALAIVALCSGLSVSVASGQTLFYDFGHTDSQSDPGSFNNLTIGTQTIADSIDQNGTGTGIGIEVTNPFFISGEPSRLGTETPSGDAAQFGVAATDDYFFGHTGAFAGEESNPLSVLEFQNLSQSKTYTLTIFSSRTGVNDNRETVFESFGTEIVSGALNPSNNDSGVLVLSGLSAGLDGTISLSVFAGPNNDNTNSFYYLGAIRLDAVPSPAGAGVLGLGGLLAGRRRRDRSG